MGSSLALSLFGLSGRVQISKLLPSSLTGETVRFYDTCLLPRNFFEKGATGVFVCYTPELEEANTEPRLE